METVNLSIDALHVHPRNQEFYDDISGDDYEQLKNSIKEDGLIYELIVAPDMTIISGHQRYKAALELGIKTVPVKIREDLSDEDKKLKILLATNFGRQKNSEEKQRKIAVEYVKLCGYKNGEIGRNHLQQCQNGTPEKLTLDEIASQLGTSKRNLQRALRIERNLTDSMKELLDTGVISKVVASDIIATLPPNEQEELVSKLDATKKYTQDQVKYYIEENEKLKKQLSRPAPVEVKVVDNTDYEALEKLEKRISKANDDYCRLSDQYKEKVLELQEVRSKLQEMEDQSPEVQYKKKICDSCILFNARVSAFIKEVGGYVWLADKINEMSPTEQHGYMLSIQRVKEWAEALEFNINKQKGEQLV